MKYFPDTLVKKLTDNHQKRHYNKFIENVYEFGLLFYQNKPKLDVLENSDMVGDFILKGKANKIYEKVYSEKFKPYDVVKYLYTSMNNYYRDLIKINDINFTFEADWIENKTKQPVNIEIYDDFVKTIKNEKSREFALSMVNIDTKVEGLSENSIRVKKHRLKNKFIKFLDN